MARVLVTLLAANLLAFLWLRGTFDDYLGAGRDPERISLQVEANRLRVLGNDRTAPARTPGDAALPAIATRRANGVADSAGVQGSSAVSASESSTCQELNTQDEASLAAIRAFFAEHASVYSTEIQVQAEPTLQLVYTLPTEDLEAAQKKLLNFKAQGFENIAIIQTGKYRLGMSFGAYRTEAEAQAMVARLSLRGVRNLRTGPLEQVSGRANVRYRFSPGAAGPPAEARSKLAALLSQFALLPKPCNPAELPRS